MYSKSQMKQKLHSKPCFVTFTKVSGDKREMVCTLNESLIPEKAKPTHSITVHDEDVVRVYDLEKEAWRSFHYSSVEKFSTRIPKDRKVG